MTAIDRGLEIVGIIAIVLAIIYRKEIAWTYRNRETLATASDLASGFDSLLKGPP